MLIDLANGAVKRESGLSERPDGDAMQFQQSLCNPRNRRNFPVFRSRVFVTIMRILSTVLEVTDSIEGPMSNT